MKVAIAHQPAARGSGEMVLPCCQASIKLNASFSTHEGKKAGVAPRLFTRWFWFISRVRVRTSFELQHPLDRR